MFDNDHNGKPLEGIDAFDDAAPAPEFTPVSPGTYHARVLKGEYTTTKAGADAYRLRFEISEGPNAGRTLIRTWTFSEKARGYTKRDLAPFGLTSSAKLLSPFPEIGREYLVRLVVAIQTFDGIDRNDIKKIDLIRIAESPAAAFKLSEESEGGGQVTTPRHDVGAFVLGAPTCPRGLVRHADLLTAYADGVMSEKDETREGYLSHFVFGSEMRTHYAANRNSVAGFAGPCWCRWLVLDIDRANLADALADAARLVRTIHDRYPEFEGYVPIYFSGGKGFHVLVELAHNPPPAVGFQHVARRFAEALAARAGITIDTAIYDVNHIIRLPNTRHQRTGLFKRRIDFDALFVLDVPRILDLAKNPAGDGIPTVRTLPAQLAADWQEAEQETVRVVEARAAVRRDIGTVDTRAPRYFMDFLRFGVDEGERHQTLFRSAAWLTEQGSPPSLVAALLTEPGRDVGLSPNDVERQIQCGIDHASKQRGVIADPSPDPIAEPEAFERWAIQHESGPHPPGALDFPYGALAPSEGGPA